MPAALDPETLLRHTGWLRRLAVELVGDVHLAEDVVQETWLAVLRRPPEVGGDERRLRAWLAQVARNLSLLVRRGDAHRAVRERGRARPEAQPSVEESLQRAELQRELMVAVMALESSQREAVVLRYLENLPPREIARRLGTTESAVGSRLWRAREALRTRLELRGGHRQRAWLLAFFPPAAPGQLAPLGGLLLKTQTQLVVTALSVAVVGSVAWWATREGSLPDLSEDSVSAPAAVAEPPRRSTNPVEPAPAAGPGERRSVLAPEPPAAAEAPAATLLGRVLDTTGRPVAGLEVRLGPSGSVPDEGATRTVTSDETGAFALPFPPAGGVLVAESENYVTLLDVRVEGTPPEDELILVVAPRCAYSGVVVDDAGRPLPGVALAAEMDPAVLRGLRPGVQRSEFRPHWPAVTGERGAFELSDVGWSPGLHIAVELPGHEPGRLDLPERSAAGLRVVLDHVRAGPGTLEGLVVDPADEPVEGALVFLREQTSKSDPEGRFVLSLDEGGASGTLRALERGHLPAELELATVAGGAPLVLRLGGEPLTISGRVVDARGDPVRDAYVWTRDGVRLPEAARRRHYEDVIGLSGLVGTDDGRMRSSRQAPTEDDGSFELTGLLPRPYTLFAADTRTCEVESAGAVEGGAADVTIVLPGTGSMRRVAGRVVSYSGEPIPQVHMLFARSSAHGESKYFAPVMVQAAPFTDEEGRFEFPALCVEGTYFLPAGPHLAGPERIFLDPLDDLEHLKIRLPRRCLVQVMLAGDPEEADACRILDAEGDFLTLVVESDDMMLSSGGMTLADGKSEVFVANETGVTLVLLRDREEVRRMPISLTPGEVQILRP